MELEALSAMLLILPLTLLLPAFLAVIFLFGKNKNFHPIFLQQLKGMILVASIPPIAIVMNLIYKTIEGFFLI